MTDQRHKAEHFLRLHRGPEPLLIPNPWDTGSAKLLQALGFSALATTSGGFAATLGRVDGTVSRDEALAHAASIVAATDVPVSADLEDGFGASVDDVVATVRGALATGLAGCSIEDSTRDRASPIHNAEHAAARVAAAAEVAHSGETHLVLTARAENYLHGRPDLDDTIARLQAYEHAGADVLYAPGITRAEDIAAVVAAVTAPVNVLALAGTPPVAELGALGVARVSVGGSFAWVALSGVAEAAQELQQHGTYGFLDRAAVGRTAALGAFRGERPS